MPEAWSKRPGAVFSSTLRRDHADFADLGDDFRDALLAFVGSRKSFSINFDGVSENVRKRSSSYSVCFLKLLNKKY